MFARPVRISCGLLLLASLCACMTASPGAPRSSAPFFQPPVEDSVQLATLASGLDTLALECAADSSCEDRIHFARALVSLFENREAARASFEQVMSLHPSSPFAASSTLWLQLLNSDTEPGSSADPQQRILMDLTAQSVREWLTRGGIDLRKETKTEGRPNPGLVQALSRQVQERERHIAELRAQLEALKVIDEDHQKRQRKMRAPASLLPNGENRP